MKPLQVSLRKRLDAVFSTCSLFLACSKVVDVVFVLDASGSIPEDDFQRILNFVRDLASRLDVESQNARVAVVTFSDNPEAVFYLNSFDQTAVRDLQCLPNLC